MAKINIEATWSGSYPCLCYGTWSLVIDGVDYTHLIPEDKRTEPMNTAQKYSRWHFDNDYNEVWASYFEGLRCDQWIAANQSWLENITADHSVQCQIFEAFQASDWRHGCCGGCI